MKYRAFPLWLIIIVCMTFGGLLPRLAQAQTQPTLSPTPIPTPSIHPTLTPSPTASPTQAPQSATLEGTVYIIGTHFAVPGDVTIEVTQQGESTDVDVDDNGHYSFDSTRGLTAGSAIIKVTSPRIETITETAVMLVPGSNHHDFYVTISKPNELKGIVYTIQNGTRVPTSGLFVSVHLDNDRNDEVAKGVTSDDGSYDIVTPDIKEGTYRVYVASHYSDDQKDALSSIDKVHFDDDRGDSVTHDLTINPVAIKYHLVINTLKSFNVLNYGEDKLVGVTVTLTGLADQQPKTVLSNITGEADFGVIPAGSYHIDATKYGYQEYTEDFELTGNADPDITTHDIYLQLSAKQCQKVPQANVQNFWFCGDAAKSLLTSRPNFAPTLDAKVGQLRAKYPEDNTLPLQIVVNSSDTQNAFYFPGGGKNNCPGSIDSGSTDEPDSGESIQLFTAFINTIPSDSDFAHVITHEWGHGKDWRAGKCNPFYSNQDPLQQLIRYFTTMSKTEVDNTLDAVKDSTYDAFSPEAGHPWDNNMEFYASDFHAATDHASEFPKGTLDASSKNLLQAITAIVTGHP